MLEAYEIFEGEAPSDIKEVVLTFDERQKSRHLTQTADGIKLGWFIERGRVLAHGDILRSQDGVLIKVVAAQQGVSQVESDDTLLLTRAAYHLGNRHVPLQIGAGYLRYVHDHVLDDMVKGLGLTVQFKKLPFQPENGAYHGQSHGHAHSHSHHQEH